MEPDSDASHFHLAGEAPTADEIRISAAAVSLLRSLLSHATEDADTAQLELEIGTLLGHPLRDTAGALEALRAAWRLQPDARQVVRAYHHAARRAEAWDDLIAALEAEARLESFGPHRAALLAELGQLLETRSGNRKAAVAAYLGAVEAHPQHVSALAALERLAIEDGDWVSAGGHADQLARACTTTELRAEFEARAAQHLHRGGEAARALGLAAQAQMRSPRSWTVQLRLEALLSREGSWTELVTLRRTQISQGDVPAAQGWFDIGIIARYRLGDSALAVEAFREAARLAEGGSRALVLAELAPLLEADREWDALLEVLGESVQLEPDAARRADLHYQMARLHEDRRADLERAAEAYERALEEDRGYLPALQGAGRLFQRLGRTDRLLRMHRLELESPQPARQRAEALRRCAQVLLEQPDGAEEAVRLLAEARALAPQNLAYFLALEGTYVRVGAWGELASLYQQELEQTEDRGRRGSLLIGLGVVAADRLGDRQRAIAAFREAGESPESGHRFILERLARLLEGEQDRESLLEVLRRLLALTEDPAQLATLYERIAAVEEQLGRVDDAVRSFEKALEVAPPTHPVFVSAGRLFLRASRYAETVEMHRRAIETAEPSEQVGLLLRSAEILSRYLDDAGGALEKLQQARGVDPAHPVVHSRLRHHLRRDGRWAALRELMAQTPADEPRELVSRATLAEAAGDDVEASRLYARSVDAGLDIAALAHLRLLFATNDWQELRARYRARPDGAIEGARAAAIACDRFGETGPALELGVAHPDDLPSLILAWPQLFSSSLGGPILPLLAERLPDPLLRAAAQERLLAQRLAACSAEEALELRGRLPASSQWNPVLLVMQEVLYETKYARAALARLRKEHAEVQGLDPALRAASAFSAGLLFEEIGSRREAISALESAVSLGGPARWITARLFLTRFCRREGDDQRSTEALRDLATVLPQCPERAACLRLLASRLAAHDRDVAISTLEEALDASPTDLQALQRLSALVTEAGQPERLIAHLQRAFEAEKEPEVTVRLGVGLAVRLFRAGRRLPARAAVRRVLAMAPDSLEAKAVAADLAVAAERWQEAAESLAAIAAHLQVPAVLRTEALARLVAIQLLHLRDREAAAQAGAELARSADDRRAVPLRLTVARILADEQAMLGALQTLVGDEELDEEERSEHQLRLAELKAERLGDRAGAIATLGTVRSPGRKQEALEKILDLASRSDHWAAAATAVDEACADGSTDPALEVAVRQRLAAQLEEPEPEAAIRQYERVVNIAPDQVGALERLAELTTRGRPREAIEHHRSLLERSPARFGLYRNLRKLFLAVGNDDAGFLCEAILEGMGCADEEERYFYRQRRPNLGKELEGALDAEERALLFPEQGQPAQAVLAALAGHVHRVLAVDLEAYACPTDVAAPPAVQLIAERLAEFLGAPPFQLLVSGGVRPAVEPGSPPVLILPRVVLEAPRRAIAFTLGSMLGRLAARAACADPNRAAPLTGALLVQLLWAACEIATGAPECPHRGRPIFEDLLRRLRAAMEGDAELLDRLQPACQRLLPLLPDLSGDDVLASLERAALRTGLLVAQDPAVALASLRSWEATPAKELAPEALKALVFVVSSPHLELRQRRKLGLS